MKIKKLIPIIGIVLVITILVIVGYLLFRKPSDDSKKEYDGDIVFNVTDFAGEDEDFQYNVDQAVVDSFSIDEEQSKLYKTKAIGGSILLNIVEQLGMSMRDKKGVENVWSSVSSYLDYQNETKSIVFYSEKGLDIGKDKDEREVFIEKLVRGVNTSDVSWKKEEKQVNGRVIIRGTYYLDEMKVLKSVDKYLGYEFILEEDLLVSAYIDVMNIEYLGMVDTIDNRGVSDLLKDSSVKKIIYKIEPFLTDGGVAYEYTDGIQSPNRSIEKTVVVETEDLSIVDEIDSYFFYPQENYIFRIKRLGTGTKGVTRHVVVIPLIDPDFLTIK